MREHFIKTPGGAVFLFRYDLNGISYGICQHNQRPESFELLAPEGKQDFDVLTDKNNTTHLVCTNNNGDIIHYCRENNIWTRKTIMKSKYPAKYSKNLRILKTESLISIFYILESDGKRMLIHQFLTEESKPFVLGCLTGGFDIETDNSGNIYAATFCAQNNKTIIYRYIWKEKKWSIFSVLNSSEEFSDISIAVDKNGNLFIATCENNSIYMYNNKKNYISRGKNPILHTNNNAKLLFSSPLSDKICAYTITQKGTELEKIYSEDAFCKNEMFWFCTFKGPASYLSKKCYGNIQSRGITLYENSLLNDKNIADKEASDNLLEAYMESEKNLIKMKERVFELKQKIDSLQKIINEVKKNG